MNNGLGRHTPVLAILGVISGIAIVFLLRTQFDRIDPGDSRQVAAGLAVYMSNCAGCHGRNLEGALDWMQRKPNGRLPPPPLDANGHTWVHSNDELVNRITFGMSGTDMPAFGTRLGSAQIRAVIAYIESTWPEDLRQHQMRQ